mmetsp:Transcript_44407/g.117833  ORF Transcript_44407/g.117833 Transcript_44407/m.117833 type:complete len:193 (-) Transcript_44407:972-1550(-)
MSAWDRFRPILGARVLGGAIPLRAGGGRLELGPCASRDLCFEGPSAPRVRNAVAALWKGFAPSSAVISGRQPRGIVWQAAAGDALHGAVLPERVGRGAAACEEGPRQPFGSSRRLAFSVGSSGRFPPIVVAGPDTDLNYACTAKRCGVCSDSNECLLAAAKQWASGHECLYYLFKWISCSMRARRFAQRSKG